jgi:adenylylsulfate kinase
MNKGIVLWFTGLPNSGKTTISRLVAKKLESMGHVVERLDSDEVPRSLTKDLSPDWDTRQKQKCTNLIFIAKLLYKYNVIVLIASVGRFQEMRNIARAEIPDFAEIYLKSPLYIRLQRDDKAKYQRYPETIHFFEEPSSPEIMIESDKCSIDESAATVIRYLVDHGYISRNGTGQNHST